MFESITTVLRPLSTGSYWIAHSRSIAATLDLSRRWELDPDVRLTTAIQIADRIEARTGLQPEGHQHVDEFLEEAARRIRDSGRFQS